VETDKLVELMLLGNVLDNLLDGCKVIDHDWRYSYVNDALARQGAHAKGKATKRYYR